MDIIKQPWFAVSPSPWSLAFYALMALIGSQLLIKAGVRYRRAQRIMAFLDALFILGVFVCLQDSIWLVFNTGKWILPFYGEVATFWNYYVRFAQNMLGIIICMLLSYGCWKGGYVRMSWKTLMWLLEIVIVIGLVFLVAPGQEFTDWTWAVRHQYPDMTILSSFLISHVIYKFLIACTFLSVFPLEHNSIGVFKPSRPSSTES